MELRSSLRLPRSCSPPPIPLALQHLPIWSSSLPLCSTAPPLLSSSACKHSMLSKATINESFTDYVVDAFIYTPTLNNAMINEASTFSLDSITLMECSTFSLVFASPSLEDSMLLSKCSTADSTKGLLDATVFISLLHNPASGSSFSATTSLVKGATQAPASSCVGSQDMLKNVSTPGSSLLQLVNFFSSKPMKSELSAKDHNVMEWSQGASAMDASSSLIAPLPTSREQPSPLHWAAFLPQSRSPWR